MGSTSSRCLDYASVGMQGRRDEMEDTAIAEFNFSTRQGIFAIFDGHNGSSCSHFLQKNYKKYLLEEPSFQEGDETDISEAMKNAALRVDEAFLLQAQKKSCQAGSTGIIAYIRGNRLWVSNTGDSRAIAIIGGNCFPLSADQKPEVPIEKKRIEENGGNVIFGRIQGILAIARAFGNLALKKEKYLIADPTISFTILDNTAQFLILACDGLWDVYSSEKVAKFVLENKHLPAEFIANELMAGAYESGSSDNISIIVVKFFQYDDDMQQSQKKEKGKVSPEIMQIPPR